MKTLLLTIGKTDAEWLRTAVADYAGRLTHYSQFEMLMLPDIKNVRGMSEEQQKKAEGAALLSKIEASDVVVLLDEGGRQFTSRGFAEFIQKMSASGAKRLVFIIGGPYGFSAEVYARANQKVSLSPMTFSHQMVRLIFVEQLYRAHTIIKGEPYHHD